MSIVLLILLGVGSAILGSLVGLGGGIIIVPSLIFLGGTGLIGGITPQTAIGTSTVILIATGLSASIGYIKAKQVDIKSGFLFLLGIVPGAIVGAYLSHFLTLKSFNLYFGLLMIMMSIVLMFRDKIRPIRFFQNPARMRSFTDAKGQTFEYSIAPVPAVMATFLVGCLTGLFGIGGGALMTPLMIIAFRFPPHIAVGTSMLMILFSSISGAISHIVQGNVIWHYAVILVVSSFIGASIGVQINKRAKSETVVLMLRLIMLALGCYLIIKSLI
ncbi:sulfite exporter TauE/SafE family protein [Macrococcus bovicus]|uniref:Probable membrane transporter protein n=1 Tax=Macrococcus bovicus TaxID=69968 RepID=A0A4V6PPV2_9STAP|nr:sulfite exporter TauE/SafE family protein [Macrococcus bovicus]TDM14738.1 sulfite exporter TauE/SafE family protein [Macrococcus bovicus]WJP98362.1 sulfite exporter TauE/SafE family protein [Macrococcus bovicus]